MAQWQTSLLCPVECPILPGHGITRAQAGQADQGGLAEDEGQKSPCPRSSVASEEAHKLSCVDQSLREDTRWRSHLVSELSLEADFLLARKVP